MRKKTASKAKKDLRDTSREMSHRLKASGERAKRRVFGPAMTPAEKAASALKEGGHRVASDVYKTKRSLRDET